MNRGFCVAVALKNSSDPVLRSEPAAICAPIKIAHDGRAFEIRRILGFVPRIGQQTSAMPKRCQDAVFRPE
jgi:hypothetical protein